MPEELKRAISKVVRNGNCSGCGACEWLFPGSVQMSAGDEGFMRPSIIGDARPGDVETFRKVCPGVSVRQSHSEGTVMHPTFGPVYSAWQGWANDDEMRLKGSSGGVLTAIAAWVVESRGGSVVASAPAGRRTVPVRIQTRAEAIHSAGSRYAPVANLQNAHGLGYSDAIIGKPCEAAAARQSMETASPSGGDGPLLLSFFCAGTPTTFATDRVIDSLGLQPEEVVSLSYRGNGWPGEFTATDSSGRTRSTSYPKSWGQVLGRDLQTRCKLCPHGTGDHADISVGDFWEADGRGFPVFDDSNGNSVVIARTRRGHEQLIAAREAGVLTLQAVELSEVEQIQPLQTLRARTLGARLLGRRLAGFSVPKYRGFHLMRKSMFRPLAFARAAAGTWQRSRTNRER